MIWALQITADPRERRWIVFKGTEALSISLSLSLSYIHAVCERAVLRLRSPPHVTQLIGRSFLDTRRNLLDIHNAAKGRTVYRGTSPIRKRPPPYDPPTTLGIGIRQGPRGVRFLVCEVPL